MDILLNELSLSGQYASREIFIEEILPTLIGVLDEIQELFRATIYKNQHFIYQKSQEQIPYMISLLEICQDNTQA